MDVVHMVLQVKIHGLLLSASSPFLSNIFNTTFSPNLEHTVISWLWIAKIWCKALSTTSGLGVGQYLIKRDVCSSCFFSGLLMSKMRLTGEEGPLWVAGASAWNCCSYCGLSLSAALWGYCANFQVFDTEQTRLVIITNGRRLRWKRAENWRIWKPNQWLATTGLCLTLNLSIREGLVQLYRLIDILAIQLSLALQVGNQPYGPSSK